MAGLREDLIWPEGLAFISMAPRFHRDDNTRN